MLLETDRNLEHTDVGVCLQAQCMANGVRLEFKSVSTPNSVMFKRKITCALEGSYLKEENMAVILSMSDVVQLVKQVGQFFLYSATKSVLFAPTDSFSQMILG